MPDAVRIHLSKSGVVTDLPTLPEHATPWKSWDLGEFLTASYSELDECADHLSIPRITTFMDSPWASESEREPHWHDAAAGVRTFEALVTELIGRLGKDDSIEHLEDVLWDLRMFELILRRADAAGEKFYLHV